jgi:glycosyltransferase involved in cell wall biosynthesis
VKVSVIVAFYKDLEALSLVLESLQEQSYSNIEIIIAEDDDNEKTKVFLQEYSHLNLKHIYHEDRGNRKIVIQNKAIAIASGEYLCFIDGDILLYEKFVENQVFLAKRKQILSGRRVNLSSVVSQLVRNKKIKLQKLEKMFYLYVLKYFLFDKNSRWEQGISLNPRGFIYKVLQKRKRNSEIIGCNWSCFKTDILAINGFNEDYGTNPVAMDTDLTWRFKANGCTLVSSKNIANCFHLFHTVSEYEDKDRTLYEYNRKNNIFIAQNGLNKYF